MKPEISISGHGGKEVLWEERWHPLREEWVIVAAHRQNRPWSGETVGRKQMEVPEYVADCYLCPGNLRVSGKKNDRYSDTFVFDNDHPCVDMSAPAESGSSTGHLSQSTGEWNRTRSLL